MSSDNAKEYLDDNFRQFLEQNRILHQPSYVYTPQQNRVVERKNRHILDIARTLLFHIQVLKKMGEAILITCYLVNRMSSFLLQHKIPYSILYPDIDLFYLPSKIFRSLCFVCHIVPIRQILILGLLMRFFLATLESESLQIFLSHYRPIYLACKCNFFRV